MLISASIIVKNEEGIIQRCLDCVSLFADEIVVVDTGSTDKTKEIAAKHPKVKLFDSEHFNKDTHYSDFRFNVAKNEAISKCSGEWIIWWDADDFVDEENAAKIRDLVDGGRDDVCLFTFTVKYGPLVFEHCRMFKNGHNLRFDDNHSVHEYLNTNGHPNYSMRDIFIQHLPGNKSVPSGKRNIAIMEKDYHERGMDDQRTLFYLANGYRENGRHKEAVDFYTQYLKKSKWPEERFFARYFMAQALVVLEKYGQARQEALRANAEDFRFAEAYCLLGDLAYKEKDYKRSQSWFQMAFDTPFPKNAKLFVSQYFYGPYPTTRIKECHRALTGDKPALQHTEMERAGSQPVTVYELPPENDEALMAGSVLAVIAEKTNKRFGIIIDHPEAQKIIDLSDKLLVSRDKDVALSLILPPKLNGRPREEWYGRAAGHVFEDWNSVVEESRKIVSEIRS
jgi:glycosyltransferase involved in cell wall biosynthesis